MMRDSGNIRDDGMTQRQRKRRFKNEFAFFRSFISRLFQHTYRGTFLRTLLKFRKRMNFDIVVSPRFNEHGNIKVHYF